MSEMSDDYEWTKATESFERRRRYERKPKSSAQLISRLVARRGFAQTEWNDQLNSVWRQVVDPQLLDKTRPTTIRRGTLEVIASSSAVLQQISFSKHELLRKLQDQLPQANSQALRFRTGRID